MAATSVLVSSPYVPETPPSHQQSNTTIISPALHFSVSEVSHQYADTLHQRQATATMVKLATARECRAYSLGAGAGSGTGLRNRWEYINAGVYIFAAVLLVGGFLAQLLPWGGPSSPGLVVAAIGLAGLLAVNTHDLLAHAAGVDYRLGMVVGLDAQMGLVELGVPAVQIVGTALMLVAVVFFVIQVRCLLLPWIGTREC